MTARRGTELHWCWAGLVTVIVSGWALVEARELFSATERLAGFDAGIWQPLAAFGVDDVFWSFHATSLTAWWLMACGALACLAGWMAHRTAVPLPYGAAGALIWLATLGVVLADNLLVSFLMLSLQSTLCGFWLLRQDADADDASPFRSFFAATLIGDALGLWGVLLTGLAWGTLELAALGDEAFVQSGWRAQPALCGLAGTWLFLSVLGRCAIFPFSAGNRLAAHSSGPANAVAFSVCVWPSVAWMLFHVQFLFQCAPEAVSLIQGLSLLAAASAAFIATGQADRRRVAALLATSQLALMLSVIAVPQGVSADGWCLVIGTVSLSSAVMFLRPAAVNSWSAGLAWWMLAGGCLSPAFWMAVQSVEEFQSLSVVAEAAQPIDPDPEISKLDTFAASAEETFRVRPLPVATWTAAWCLWSFCSAFAAWRAWREEMRANESLSEGEKTDHPSHAPFFILALCVCAILVAAAARSGWLAFPSLGVETYGPAAAAIAASLAGWLVSAWVCRDPARIEANFQKLGSWSELARQDLHLDRLTALVVERPLAALAELARRLDEALRPGAGRFTHAAVVSRLTAAVGELRNEPAAFYAVALGLTIGSLLITWLTLAG